MKDNITKILVRCKYSGKNSCSLPEKICFEFLKERKEFLSCKKFLVDWVTYIIYKSHLELILSEDK